MVLSIFSFQFSISHAQMAQNRPYVDDKLFHFGFQLGLNFSSFLITDSETPIITGKAKSILYLQSLCYSLSKIAQQLDIKESTVKYHIKENYRKLDVKNKIDAVLTAKRLGII